MTHFRTILFIAIFSTAAGLCAQTMGLWMHAPEAVLCVVTCLLALMMHWRRAWVWPLLMGTTLCAYILADALNFNPVIPVVFALAGVGLWATEKVEDRFTAIQKVFLSGGSVGAGFWIIDYPNYLAADGWVSAAMAPLWVGMCSCVWALPWFKYEEKAFAHRFIFQKTCRRYHWPNAIRLRSRFRLGMSAY